MSDLSTLYEGAMEARCLLAMARVLKPIDPRASERSMMGATELAWAMGYRHCVDRAPMQIRVEPELLHHWNQGQVEGHADDVLRAQRAASVGLSGAGTLTRSR